MAAEGSELEGALRRGSREEGEERDDSEGYVFVEGRESDESSLEDLHVVDPAGDEPGHRDRPGFGVGQGDLSESYIEIPGEEAGCVSDGVGAAEDHADRCPRSDEDGLVVCGESMMCDLGVEVVGDDKSEEQSNAESAVVTVADVMMPMVEEIVHVGGMQSPELESCSLEDEVREKLPLAIAGSGDLDESQKEQVGTSSMLGTSGEEMPKETVDVPVDCEPLANELSVGIIEAVELQHEESPLEMEESGYLDGTQKQMGSGLMLEVSGGKQTDVPVQCEELAGEMSAGIMEAVGLQIDESLLEIAEGKDLDDAQKQMASSLMFEDSWEKMPEKTADLPVKCEEFENESSAGSVEAVASQYEESPLEIAESRDLDCPDKEMGSSLMLDTSWEEMPEKPADVRLECEEFSNELNAGVIQAVRSQYEEVPLGIAKDIDLDWAQKEVGLSLMLETSREEMPEKTADVPLECEEFANDLSAGALQAVRLQHNESPSERAKGTDLDAAQKELGSSLMLEISHEEIPEKPADVPLDYEEFANESSAGTVQAVRSQYGESPLEIAKSRDLDCAGKQMCSSSMLVSSREEMPGKTADIPVECEESANELSAGVVEAVRSQYEESSLEIAESRDLDDAQKHMGLSLLLETSREEMLEQSADDPLDCENFENELSAGAVEVVGSQYEESPLEMAASRELDSIQNEVDSSLMLETSFEEMPEKTVDVPLECEEFANESSAEAVEVVGLQHEKSPLQIAASRDMNFSQTEVDSSFMPEASSEEMPEKPAVPVECEGLTSELSSGVAEVVGSQHEPVEQESLTEEYSGKTNKHVEVPGNHKDGEECNDESVLPFVVSPNETGVASQNVVGIEASFTEEVKLLEDEGPVLAESKDMPCLEVVESREVCLHDSLMPEERTYLRFVSDRMVEEASQKAEEESQSVQIFSPILLQQLLSTKSLEHEEVVDFEGGGDKKVEEHAESVTKLPIRSTDRELDGAPQLSTFLPLHSEQEKMEVEWIAPLRTDIDLYPNPVESRELSINSYQIPIEQHDSGLNPETLQVEDSKQQADNSLVHEKTESEVSKGIEVCRLHHEPTRKEEDDIQADTSDEVKVTKYVELVAEDSITMPVKEDEDSDKLSSNLHSCVLEVSSVAKEESNAEAVQNREVSTSISDLSSDQPVSNNVLQYESIKEVASGYVEYEETLSQVDSVASEASELNQEALGNKIPFEDGSFKGNEKSECMRISESEEQKHYQLDTKIPTEASKDHLDNIAEPSYGLESIHPEDEVMETQVQKPTDYTEKMDRNAGEKEAEDLDMHPELVETMPTIRSTNEASIDPEVCDVVPSQFILPIEMQPCRDGEEGISSTNVDPIISCSVDSIEGEGENPCLVNSSVSEMPSSGLSFGNFRNIISHSLEHMASEVDMSQTSLEDGTQASILQHDTLKTGNTIVESGTNANDYNERLPPATNIVESVGEIEFAFVDDKEPDSSDSSSKEAKDEKEKLEGPEQNEFGVVEEEMHLARSADIGRFDGSDTNYELEGIAQSETTLSVSPEGSVEDCKDNTTTTVSAGHDSHNTGDTSSETELEGQPQNQFIPQYKGHGVPEEDNVNACTHSIQEVTDNLVKDTRIYIVRLRRNQDDKMTSRIELAQLQVDEKTENRDSVRKMIRTQKSKCDELWKNVEEVRKEERAARQAVASKHQELKSIRERANMIELVNSIDDTDDKMNSLNHRIQHETIPLKEEKQLLQKIKELKHKREDLSSKLATSTEMEKAFEQKGEIQGQLKCLMTELEPLRKGLLQAEIKSKAAKKKYDDEYQILRNLQEQRRAADDLRQATYTHLRDLKTELNEKNMHFYKYRDDARAAAKIASSGDKEALRSHCCDQIERFMELWNKNDEFRNQYVNTNQLSIIRRFGTLDGRSLGPDEEPAVLPYAPAKASSTNDFPPLRGNSAQPKEIREETKDKIVISEKADKPLVHKPLMENIRKNDKEKKPPKTSPEIARGPISTEENNNKDMEKAETKSKESAQGKTVEDAAKTVIDELARKEGEEQERRRREQAAAELKEKIRLEQIAKAKEAEERKRRKAEKAKAIAESRAQRESELKEKKKAKKERLKEKKASGKADVTTETDEREPRPSSPPEAVEITEAKVSNSLPPSVKQQSYGKKKPLPPPPLRNRGKRKIQTWMWALLCALLVGILFFLGNHASLRGSQSLGF